MGWYFHLYQADEWDGSKYITITADFRKYPCVEKSIADHSAYLLGAMNGSKKRYDGVKGCKDYKKAIQIIKDGGYATSPTYVEKLCEIIERWKLTKWDEAEVVDKVEDGADAGGAFSGLKCQFLVKVSILDLNIRKGPGTNYKTIGKYTGVGVFTIMEVNDGTGSDAGWGRLKSGAGWISLDYCKLYK